MIHVQWQTEFNRGYVISCYLVRKLTSDCLLSRMKSKGSKPAEFTRGLSKLNEFSWRFKNYKIWQSIFTSISVKEKLYEDADSEIATTMLRVSLICPLGKMRMSTPCRASTCMHLQCFDASLYLQMNERKPWELCFVFFFIFWCYFLVAEHGTARYATKPRFTKILWSTGISKTSLHRLN